MAFRLAAVHKNLSARVAASSIHPRRTIQSSVPGSTNAKMAVLSYLQMLWAKTQQNSCLHGHTRLLHKANSSESGVSTSKQSNGSSREEYCNETSMWPDFLCSRLRTEETKQNSVNSGSALVLCLHVGKPVKIRGVG